MMISGSIDSAVKTLWATPGCKDGGEAFRILKEAANNGDGDACYFLARCYMGACFVNPIFGFECNDPVGHEYLDKSIELGSPLGMLGSMRVGGYTPPNGCYPHEPYNSIEALWNAVVRRAEQGELFCQLIIANAYYYGDVISIFPDAMPERVEDFENNVQKWLRAAIPLYENCAAAGMETAYVNLTALLKENPNVVPDSKQRISALHRMGADMKIGFCEMKIGCEYVKNKQPEKAIELFKSAVSHGCTKALFELGDMYTFGGAMPLDLYTAVSYFKEELTYNPERSASYNGLGEIYFKGGENFAPDYNKAFSNLLRAYELGNDWGAGMLGTCYLKGLGTNADYARAKEIFEKLKSPAKNKLAAIGLGEIYAYGLGVTPDVNKGMEYWNLYPDDPRVIENKKRFKKKLFKGWVRID